VAIELFAFLWDIHPQAAMPTYGAGALDSEPHEIGWLSRRRQVNVGSNDIGSSPVSQWQQVDILVCLAVLRRGHRDEHNELRKLSAMVQRIQRKEKQCLQYAVCS